MKIHRHQYLLLSLLLLSSLLTSPSTSFESDELLENDDEFEGVVKTPDLNHNPSIPPPIRRKPDLDFSSSSSDSKPIQFNLEHSLGGGDDFSPAGTFTARLKSWSHGGQVRIQ